MRIHSRAGNRAIRFYLFVNSPVVIAHSFTAAGGHGRSTHFVARRAAVCNSLALFGKVRHNSRIESWFRVYVRSITRSTMYQKSSILLAVTGVWKISSIACGFSSIKIDYSDYPKSLMSRINEVYVFFAIAIFY